MKSANHGMSFYTRVNVALITDTLPGPIQAQASQVSTATTDRRR